MQEVNQQTLEMQISESNRGGQITTTNSKMRKHLEMNTEITANLTSKAVSNSSHGTASQSGYAFAAAASLYAPGSP